MKTTHLIGWLLAALLVCIVPVFGEPEPAAPATKKARTETDREAERAKWTPTLTSDLYEKFGDHGGKPDPRIVAYLREAVTWNDRVWARGDRSDLLKEGQALCEAGASDPWFLAAIGEELVRAEHRTDGLVFLERASKGVESSKYPAWCRYRIAAVHGHTLLWADRPEAEWQPLFESAGMHLVEAIRAMEFPQPAVEFLWQQLRMPYDDLADPKIVPRFIAALESLETGDRWLRAMVIGDYFRIRAWQFRGDGFANTVKPEMWEPFFENLEKSEAYLMEAHRHRPDDPAGPTTLIWVTNALGDRATEPFDHWFRVTKEIEFDYRQAYLNFIGAMRPRWQGSHEEMLALGRWAVSTERFDTRVPLMLIDANNYIGKDAKNDYSFLAEDQVLYQSAMSTLEKLLAEDERRLKDAPNRLVKSMFDSRYKTDILRMIVLSDAAGDHTRTFEMFARHGFDLDPKELGEWGIGAARPIVLRAMLFGGPGHETAQRARQAEDSGKLADALRLFNEARADPRAAELTEKLRGVRDGCFHARTRATVLLSLSCSTPALEHFFLEPRWPRSSAATRSPRRDLMSPMWRSPSRPPMAWS